ncbi:MAG: T9SS type A sorting domain-containing protein [Bacteroidales bacterium]|nr:T9SS type A sorting domain-containing protein [Bacteroidales bacterium]
MKKILLFIAALGFLQFVNAQQTRSYNFENSLNETGGNGPALTVLGNTGNFVVETLNEINGTTKTVYRFEANSGLQFNDQAAGNFLGGNYTIEIYFVFDNLSSWKRVVDWKNRKTDWGAYVYNGKLNFYSILYSEEAPVLAGAYTYYVITRNGDDNNVLIYTDAEVKINFTDSNGDALIDGDGMLNFFHDDLMVPNEASSGAVAMIKLYDYPLSQEKITQNWNALGSQVFGIGKIQNELPLGVYPNPATTGLSVDLKSFSQAETLVIKLYNSDGHLVYMEKLSCGGIVKEIPVSVYPSGMYLLQVEGSGETGRSRVIIR